jgi:hypothetical protein
MELTFEINHKKRELWISILGDRYEYYSITKSADDAGNESAA